MNIRTVECLEHHYQALFAELEKRYGPYVAQEIVDQIRKADAKGAAPDYMQVKALSEALELFRLELRNTIRRLKVVRHEMERLPDGIVDLDARRLELRVLRLLPLYRLLMHGYYRRHASAMAAYTRPVWPARPALPEAERMAA